MGLQRVGSKATLWVKAQHEGALPPPCIVRKDPSGAEQAQSSWAWSLVISLGAGREQDADLGLPPARAAPLLLLPLLVAATWPLPALDACLCGVEGRASPSAAAANSAAYLHSHLACTHTRAHTHTHTHTACACQPA